MNKKIYGYIVAGFITLIVVFLIWFFQDIVAYTLISVVLSLMGKPLVDLLAKIKIKDWAFPKWLASTITLIVLWAVIIGLFYAFVPLIFSKASELAKADVPGILNALKEPLQGIESLINKTLSADKSKFSIIDTMSTQLQPILSIDFVNHVVSRMSGIISSIAIGIFSVSFITFFFLKEDKLFYEGVVILFPKKYEPNIRRALASINNLLVRYFIGLVIESTIKLIFISLALYLIGIEFGDALIIALISAILNVIPYIGPLIGALIGIALGAASYPDISLGTLALQMGIIFLAFQTLDNIIIQPYIYSSSVKAHPLEIFIVILIAGNIAGIMGMLLAIPAYTVLRVFAKEFFNNFRIVQKLTENI